jgi:DNA-binding beta-propeller fold protein YncE
LWLPLAGLLAALALAGPAAAADPATLELVGTIQMKGEPGRLDHMAIDTKGQRLFVANLSNNSLDILDLKAGKVIKQIPNQRKIQGVAYVPDLDRIFVGNGVDGVGNAFDGKTYELVGSVKLPAADNVRYDPRTKQVYIAYEKALAVLDPMTLKLKEIPVPGQPESFQIEPTRPRLYLNIKPDLVVVIDTDKNEVVSKYTLTLARVNNPMALDAKGGRLYIGCRQKPMVVVLDAETGKEVGSVEIPNDIDDLFHDARRERLYATCGEGVVAIIGKKGPDRWEIVERITVPKLTRTCFFDAEAGRLYVPVPRQEGQEGPVMRVYQARP